ncbi:MAG: bifunctional diaminohydroxyphosphoribosylaminopyrimidine deaminase/5-amino-6-(5-phosphoribosylamino)uracil reductase RibD [Alphaproteobacteria bacterium]
MQDRHAPFMQEALRLAQSQLGQTWPNPAVGAVIVKNGMVIAKGYTATGGRPHAETEALAKTSDTRGATLYVSLEPCAHHGRTPPCTDAIIHAGITECVIACRDTHPKVNGKGIAALQAAGINVIEGVCEANARELNRGFFSLSEKKRPYIAMKIATSKDGKIAYPPGDDRKWITGEAAREEVHKLRSRYDAVLTGIGTVLADDPLLTCRLPGMEHKSPVRVVLDRKGRLPEDCQLMKTKQAVPLWVLGSSTIEQAVQKLAHEGITRLLVEAGQGVNTAFLQSGLVDRIYWVRAPFDIGIQGIDAFFDMEAAIKLLATWRKLVYSAHPPDSCEIFEPCSPAS